MCNKPKSKSYIIVSPLQYYTDWEGLGCYMYATYKNADISIVHFCRNARKFILHENRLRSSYFSDSTVQFEWKICTLSYRIGFFIRFQQHFLTISIASFRSYADVPNNVTEARRISHLSPLSFCFGFLLQTTFLSPRNLPHNCVFFFVSPKPYSWLACFN